MIVFIWYALAGIFGALLGASLMKDVHRRVAAWLRQHGLAESHLMHAVVLLDRAGTALRASVKVSARSVPAQTLALERSYPVAQITDPDVLAALKNRGHAELNVMRLFNTA
jgi:phosphoribosyl-dephospho-CoA transferase